MTSTDKLKKGAILVPIPGEKLNDCWDFTEDFSVICEEAQRYDDTIYTKIHTGFLTKNGKNQHGKNVGYTILLKQFKLPDVGDLDYEFF